MAPPDNAIVICVDERPSIQDLERAQGYLKRPNGGALTGHSRDYKRNGTSTLFAAFEVATSKVTAAHKTRRRRIEFLDFMNDIVIACPGNEEGRIDSDVTATAGISELRLLDFPDSAYASAGQVVVGIDYDVSERVIGRASCRERVCQYVLILVGAVSLK